MALNVDTGKMAWYFQASPHDTHDWDAVQTPVLIDGELERQAAQDAGAGQPQRLLLPAGPRNGEHLVTAPFIETMNWSKGIDAQRPADAAIRRKTRPSMACWFRRLHGGATNWPPPSFDPETKLFYVGTVADVQRVLSDRHRPASGRLRRRRTELRAASATRCALSITRPARPSGGTTIRAAAGFAGMLTTAGKLLFTGDGRST